ncbi:MAG: hypothetical protein PHP82_03150 [Candidatus ainarchaeum sp.]|nr:hypothetical protein [Candidatus ainarchaeum sp.]
MKQWFKTKFGLAPFKEVQLIEFSYSNIKNQKENSMKQYNLLLNEEVIQAHIELSTKKGIMILVLGTNPEQLLKKEGFEYKIISKKIISYEKVLENNNQFKI